MIVTIDGPAGTGKSTVAKRVAQRLNLPYFDTGAMYRAISWYLIEKKCPLDKEKEIEHLLEKFLFSIREGRYFVGETDVTKAIRSEHITAQVSAIAALEVVRTPIWKLQRELGEKHGGVFEGRDMGSFVFPNAEYKFFLTASAQVRAQRRFTQLEKEAPEELSCDITELQKAIEKRDASDSSRAVAPLQVPEGAHIIDTSSLQIEEVVDALTKKVESSFG